MNFDLFGICSRMKFDLFGIRSRMNFDLFGISSRMNFGIYLTDTWIEDSHDDTWTSSFWLTWFSLLDFEHGYLELDLRSLYVI